jgi:all-trans-8'-apo-beta-carotenal 15,15'-oxygenase
MDHSTQRRVLLKSAATALAGLAPIAGWSRSAAEADVPSAQALSAWRDSFLAVQTDYGPVTVKFDHPLPDGLRGTLYRNGPALMQRGTTRYRHWFDGDGMVHAFQLDGNRLTHHARSIRTKRFEAEQAANRYLWDGFGTSFADARAMGKPDDVNPANISLLQVGNELLALWEAGSPYRIDPKTLETRGRKVFSDDTDGMPFSAHPRVDRDGTIWNFGTLAGSGKLALYKLAPSGKLVEAKLIDAPNADMVHDFAITERYLVFVLMPLIAQPRGSAASMLERFRWEPGQATVVLVVDKNTLTIRHRAELPASALFHLGNAWEDGTNLRIQIMRIGNFHGLMNAMYASMQAEPVTPFSTLDDGPVELLVDLNKANVKTEPLAQGNFDFPSFDKRYIGQRTDHLFSLSFSKSMPQASFGLNKLVGINRQTQSMQSFDYGGKVLADEHLFIPKPQGKAGVGWVLGTSYRWTDRRTLLSVFDAQDIAAGPISQAVLPRGLPPGLHGLFMPA